MIESKAVAEVDRFERVRDLCIDGERFTAAFRVSMESLTTPLASAILGELDRREVAL